MHEQKEEIWRVNGNIHVRSRFGSSNYTMLTVLVIVLVVPTGLPIFGSLLQAFDIGFIGESAQTIAMSIGFAAISFLPAIVLGRLIIAQFRHFREMEIGLEQDRLVAPGFKRKWSKVTSVSVRPATTTNFRIVPFLLIIRLVDKIFIVPLQRRLPHQLSDQLNRDTYAVWINGRIVGGVFYDPDVAAQLASELANEAEAHSCELDLQQAELAL